MPPATSEAIRIAVLNFVHETVTFLPNDTTLHDPAVIRKILAHLALGHSGQSPGPAPPESGAAAP